MKRDRTRLPAGGLAVAGTIAAHALTYAAVAGAGAGALLRDTGHGYLGVVAAVSAAAGVIAAASVFARRAFVRGNCDEIRPVGFAAGLAARQCVLFTAVEIVERLAHGVPASGVFDGGILWLGLVGQTLVAVALTASLVLLTRGVERATLILSRTAGAPHGHPILSPIRPGSIPAWVEHTGHILVRGPPQR